MVIVSLISAVRTFAVSLKTAFLGEAESAAKAWFAVLGAITSFWTLLLFYNNLPFFDKLTLTERCDHNLRH